MQIIYSIEPDLSSAEFADVLRRSTLAERRPAGDMEKLANMLRHADVIVTARDSRGTLIGVSRALTDYSYCTYLSDLAVDQNYQRQGIGRQLISHTHEKAGRETTLILLSAPQAAAFYQHIGMQQHKSCWVFPTAELTGSPPQLSHPAQHFQIAPARRQCSLACLPCEVFDMQ